MAQLRIAAHFALLFLLTLPYALAQTMTSTHSHSGQLALVDHHPYCGGSGTLTCWHQESSTFSGVWATTRGMLATDSSGCIYTGSNPVGLMTWTKQTSLGCSWTNPQYDANGVLYALATGTGNLSLKDDPNGTWQGVNGTTAIQFSVAANGEQFFCKVNLAGALNCTADPLHAWTAEGSGYKYVQVLSSQTWLTVKTDGTVWVTHSGTSTRLGTITNAVQVNGVLQTDLSGNMLVYYRGTDGFIYHKDPSSASGWTKQNGSGNTALAVGGPFQVMSLGGTGGTHLYRFGESSPKISITYNGTVNCNVPNPPGPGYCNQFTHTAFIKSCWGTKGCHQVNATGWSGVGQWGVTATSEPQEDPIACLDNPLMDGCTPNENGAMNCSGGGSDTQNNDFDFGISRDVRTWDADEPGYPSGPTLSGSPAGPGTWTGYDNFTHHDSCIAGAPTCETPNPLLIYDSCAFPDSAWYPICYEQVYSYIHNVPQTSSPFVENAQWIEEMSTGILVCVQDPVFWTRGNYGLIPAVCQ